MPGCLPGLIRQFISLCTRIPNTLLAFVARFSIAAVFWKSGQTKVQGFEIDIVNREFTLGWPRLSDSVVDLFRDEYRLPLVPPEIAATMAAFAEHFFPVLILLGLATRLSALGSAGHDDDDPVVCLPRCLPHPRHLGRRAAVPDGARARQAVAGPLDRAALPAKMNTALGWLGRQLARYLAREVHVHSAVPKRGDIEKIHVLF